MTTIHTAIDAFWKSHREYKQALGFWLTAKRDSPPLWDIAGHKQWKEMVARLKAIADDRYVAQQLAYEAVVAARSNMKTYTLPLVSDASAGREWRS